MLLFHSTKVNCQKPFPDVKLHVRLLRLPSCPLRLIILRSFIFRSPKEELWRWKEEEKEGCVCVCVPVCVCVYVFMEVGWGREMMNIPLWLPLRDKTLTFIPKRKNVEVLPSWKV